MAALQNIAEYIGPSDMIAITVYIQETERDTVRLDALEELPGISIYYNPDIVADRGPTLRSQIDEFLARLDEEK